MTTDPKPSTSGARVRLLSDLDIRGDWQTLASRDWATPHHIPAGTEGELLRGRWWADDVEILFVGGYGIVAGVPVSLVEFLT